MGRKIIKGANTMRLTYRKGENENNDFEFAYILTRRGIKKAIADAKRDCIAWGGVYMAYSIDSKDGSLTYTRLGSKERVEAFKRLFYNPKEHTIITL